MYRIDDFGLSLVMRLLDDPSPTEASFDLLIDTPRLEAADMIAFVTGEFVADCSCAYVGETRS